MTKNGTPTPVYLDPGMQPGLEVKGLIMGLFISPTGKFRCPADELIRAADELILPTGYFYLTHRVFVCF